jgi:hypothetical protein
LGSFIIKNLKKNYNKITKDNTNFPQLLSKQSFLILKNEIDNIIKKTKRPKVKSHGEPLKYSKTFCYKILDGFIQGKDKIAISAELGITYQRFCSWRKLYPEFEYSVRIGEQLSIRFWTEVGRLNLFNDKFNHVLWMMNMTNKFKWFSNKNKEEHRIVNKKVLELKIDDNRIARISKLAGNNQTIIEAGKFTEDQQAVYTD